MKDKWLIYIKMIILWIALLFLLFSGINSFLFSSNGYELDRNGLWKILRDFVGCTAFYIMCWLIAYVLEKRSKALYITGVLLIFLSVMIFSAWWIANSANLPQSDAKSVYDIAYRAKDHDLLPIAPTGSYMSLWPFQSGLVLFFETILRLIPYASEMTIQWLYLPFMGLSLISGYMVVKRMFSSKRTTIFWCLMMLFCLPYYLHINNMYGEIPSIALSLFALWMLSEYSAKPFWLKLLLAGMGLTAAVAVRKNTLIFILACILVWAVVYLAKKKLPFLFILLTLITATAFGIIFPQKFYEYRANNIMGKGVPAVSYIAMGMQWDEGRIPGGWNGYHSDLFIECSFDTELASQISSDSIKASFHYMAEHPDYMLRFYYYKLVEQWTREDFACLYETLDFFGDRTPAAWAVYQGEARDKILYIMTVHQSDTYLGAVCFCILGVTHLRKKGKSMQNITDTGDMEQLILFVTFIGGFLFSIIWEANSRYTLPYFIMLIPYAADGLAAISYQAEKRICHLH